MHRSHPLLDPTPRVVAIRGVDLRLVDGAWPIDAAMRAEVEAHWTAATAAKAGLWNGPVVAVVAPGRPGGLAIADGVLTGTALRDEFKTLLAWCDRGLPEIGMRNLFGSALVLSSDGALIYGRMAGSTAWAGWIYPPGGGIDLEDVGAGGAIDLDRVIAKELREETGLDIADGRAEGLLVGFSGGRVSVGRVIRFAEAADALAERIRAHVAAQADPELDEVVVVRRPSDLDDRPAVMPFARLFAERLCAGCGATGGDPFHLVRDTLES